MTMNVLGVEPLPGAWAERTGSDRLSLFLDRMRRDWKVACGVVIACMVTAGVLAFVLPSYWRVEIMVMPVSRNGPGNISLGDLAGGLGSLGALLRRPSTTEDEALAVLRSRELFDTYASRQNLLPILFSDRWDSARKRWDVSSARVPTLREGYKLFSNHIRDIDEDRRTGIITMGITWKDRSRAMQWARNLIDLTNSQLRERAMAEASQNMRYLSGQMRSDLGLDSSNALNAALASAYERQLQAYMFAKGEKEFAFRIIDPPTYPDDRERVWPQRKLLLALGLIMGCIAAVAVVHLREFLGRQPWVQTGPVGLRILAGRP